MLKDERAVVAQVGQHRPELSFGEVATSDDPQIYRLEHPQIVPVHWRHYGEIVPLGSFDGESQALRNSEIEGRSFLHSAEMRCTEKIPNNERGATSRLCGMCIGVEY